MDHRRKNRSDEGLQACALRGAAACFPRPRRRAPETSACADASLPRAQENVKRLKAYKAKLILFPRRSGKAKKPDSAAEDLAVAAQLKTALLPITKAAPKIESVPVTQEMQAAKAYSVLRLERMNARLVGIRAKKAAEAAKEAEQAAK